MWCVHPACLMALMIAVECTVGPIMRSSFGTIDYLNDEKLFGVSKAIK